ncbi:hypothetical protein B0J14DRAFT_653716 [Halenospora varia]|nr:hypothetical protein B0J14DRAFT_653716 [Halenospora varia]
MPQTPLPHSLRLLLRDHQSTHETFCVKMAAISTLAIRDTVSHLAKRGNWASHEAGVIVVFCIVFVVAAGLIGLFLTRLIKRKAAAREASRSTV